MPIPLPPLDATAPPVALAHLDEFWSQVGVTLCNLACRHCFESFPVFSGRLQCQHTHHRALQDPIIHL
jgi:hypothetical protein